MLVGLVGSMHNPHEADKETQMESLQGGSWGCWGTLGWGGKVSHSSLAQQNRRPASDEVHFWTLSEGIIVGSIKCAPFAPAWTCMGSGALTGHRGFGRASHGDRDFFQKGQGRWVSWTSSPPLRGVTRRAFSTGFPAGCPPPPGRSRGVNPGRVRGPWF